MLHHIKGAGYVWSQQYSKGGLSFQAYVCYCFFVFVGLLLVVFRTHSFFFFA
jgi:hypothetical protein